MAEFTDDDKRILDMLRKALLERKGSTLPSLAPWQESANHQTAVLSDRGAVPADVVRGMSGSWAASYSFDPGSSVVPTGSDTQIYAEGRMRPGRSSTFKVGHYGLPEINFPLYHSGTNAFGSKGPALIGSPISFEVVGPTLKSPATDWTWQVTLGTGPNGGDELTLSTRADGGPATCSTLAAAYNLPTFTMGDLNEPNGGLYLIIVDDGTSGGSLPAGVPPMTPLPNSVETARYEIFRVASVRTDTLEIHPNKPFRTVYNVFVGTFGVKGILLCRPFATRLAALPSQLRGREQNFAVVAPERAASGDLYPPYDGGTPGDGTWLQGGFTELTAPGSGNAAGSTSVYMGRQSLPIPTPIGEFTGVVESGAAPSQPVGVWVITLGAPAPASLSQKILRVYQVSRFGVGSKLLYGDTTACLGYFQVLSLAGNDIRIARVPEVDPNTGRVFYGPGPFVQVLAGEAITVYFTVHRPIRELFNNTLNTDDIEASRLAPLLAPSWTERARKQIGGTGRGQAPGSSRAKPDRAIFDTRTISFPAGGLPEPADPGNLLDLGFRMVIFPARLDTVTGFPVPDFSRPITSREAIIDPAITDPQYIEVDYDAGLVRLSHPPPVGSGGDIVPHGIISSTQGNPREEVILFACTVPYTTETSQRGMGPALITKTGGSFSNHIWATINTFTNYTGTPPYIGPSGALPNPVEIVLDRIWGGPPTGVVEILEGGLGGRSFGTWSYTGGRIVTTGSYLVSTLLLPASTPAAIDPTPGAGESRVVVLRREVIQGVLPDTNATSTDDYTTDRSYGMALRASTLRLPRDRVFLDPDGAMSVASGPAFSWAEKTTGYLAPSKLPFPPGNPTFGSPVDSYFGEYGILCNMDYEVTPGDPRAPTPGGPFRRWFEGSSIELAALDTPPNWHGIITSPENISDGIIRVNQGIRLSVRFKAEVNNVPSRVTFFIGFVQDEGVADTKPTVFDATSGPTMAPTFSAMGLFISATNGIRFWGRGSDGITANDKFLNTGISTDSTMGPWTFVMETSSWPEVNVRYGIFDDQGMLLASNWISVRTFLPSVLLASKGLFFVAGVNNEGDVPPDRLQIYHVSLTQRFGEFDLPFLP